MKFPDEPKKRYQFTATTEIGMDSGRRRYRVVCLECGDELHEATTGPMAHTHQHDEIDCNATPSRRAVLDAAMSAGVLVSAPLERVCCCGGLIAWAYQDHWYCSHCLDRVDKTVYPLKRPNGAETTWQERIKALHYR
ncbi:MAG: hypothetical protein GY835_23985 [bacterium]|nr:hypothetical protein [bacterium]